MNAILMNAAANQQPQGPLPATWAGSPAGSWPTGPRCDGMAIACFNPVLLPSLAVEPARQVGGSGQWIGPA
jgi:hypothetical protein